MADVITFLAALALAAALWPIVYVSWTMSGLFRMFPDDGRPEMPEWLLPASFFALCVVSPAIAYFYRRFAGKKHP